MSSSTLNEQLMPPAQSSAPATYYPVSRAKVVVLSLLTLGLYELYWQYKNWKYVKQRDSSRIWPPARAIFGALWFGALLADLKRHSARETPATRHYIWLAIAYFALLATWRLPDPFWLIVLLSFLPMLPAVDHIREDNAGSRDEFARNSRWRWWHVLLAIVVGPLLAVVVASASGLIPSTQVVPGWMVWGPSRKVLDDYAILEKGERIRYYYSNAAFSFADDGNILTDRRVISYWTDPDDGELYVDSARFAEIRARRVERGSLLEPTILTVVRHDGSEFILNLSTESRRDELFITELTKELPRQGKSPR